MKANNIERGFLKSVREASPDDCKVIIDILNEAEKRDGFIDITGEYTDLGLLLEAIKEELLINGVLKIQY